VFKIDAQKKSANIPRTIRFTEDLYERLAQTAQMNSVSFNYLVLQCCQYAIDHLDVEEASSSVDEVSSVTDKSDYIPQIVERRLPTKAEFDAITETLCSLFPESMLQNNTIE